MLNKKLIMISVVCAVLIVSGFVVFNIRNKSQAQEIIKEITPHIGTIGTTISTTGTVLPKNRLEVKPQVNGRIESILVKEGQQVKIGQTLAWMSSTERAALLDAAQGQGTNVLNHWKEIYKPIPVLSPINGEVIVATIQPGQTVTTTDDVVVLSDHLIVRAQVDETDISKIKLGQKVFISLDAYPNEQIEAAVEHIYYESSTVNNVTIYNVDLLPKNVPPFFRSGMNATVNFETKSKNNALLLPTEAIKKENDENYVLLKQEGGKNPVRRAVKLGLSDDRNYEILSGVDASDMVMITTKQYVLPTGNMGSNPFMPKFPSKRSQGGSPPV